MQEHPTAVAGALAARAHDLLSAVGHPLTAETLVEHVFGIATPRSGSQRGGGGTFLLAHVLKDPAIFTQYSDGTWGLTDWGNEGVLLDEMEYVVVDCETTGLNPQTQRVIEIGALRCRGPRVLERFNTFIDPERSIPLGIRQLTGITPELVRGAPKAPEAIAAFLAFAGGSMLVGHNVRFDYNFLGAEALRHHQVRLLNPSMCTIKLAGRLLPHLKRPNLDNLARVLDLRTQDRHRAMGDAEVTQQAFWRLVELARQQGVATQGRLQALVGAERGSARSLGSRERGRDLLLLNPEVRKSLPDKPGVYLMKDERGKIIYIGKAKSLKKRLASYYNHPVGYVRKMDALLETVRDLELRVVGSELEALILESCLIKAHTPQYNVQQKYYQHYPFIKVDVASPFPRVWAAREVRDDGARYFGPFRSKRAVDTVVDLVQRMFPIRTCTRVIAADGSHRGKHSPCFRYLVGRCLGPCMGGVTAERYRAVIDEVLAFLGGGNDGMLAHVEEAMFRAARSHDFERAARLRDALQQARRLLLSQQLLTGAIERNNLVIVCPSVQPEAVELFGIRHGRLFEQCSLPLTDGVAAQATILEFLGRLEAAAAAPPVIVGKEELDAIIIIGSWLARFGASRRVVQLPACPDEATTSTLLETARAVLALPREARDEWCNEEDDTFMEIAD